MATDWHELPGQESTEPSSLKIPKAIEFHRAIVAHPYARFLECRRSNEVEVVVLEVDVEVPQRPALDIRQTERVAVIFGAQDDSFPDVVSLRTDFPSIPHLNLRPIGAPRSLCLYEQPYPEIKLKWTGFRFLERIRGSLAGSAKGELHGADQPLEPLVAPSAYVLTISNDFLEAPGQSVDFFHVEICETGIHKTFVASKKPGLARNSIGILLEGKVLPHGVIVEAPSTLRELHDFAAAAGLDVIGALQSALRTYKIENPFPATNYAYVLILLRLPKSRYPGGPKETQDLAAFFCFEQLGSLGEKLGLWRFHNGSMGILLNQETAIHAETVQVFVLRPQPAMSATVGAGLSGTTPRKFEGAFIGVGSLGSNLLSHFVRTGFGLWKIIDNDVLMSHNFGRHIAHWGVGLAKVQVVAQQLNAMFDEEPPLTPNESDVLEAHSPGQLQQVLQSAAVVVDCAASVPISRFLAIDVASNARRISAFLNPRGTDVVVLVEDRERSIRLDHLEIQYYAALIRHPALQQHLQRDTAIRRYSNACRDTSVVIPEECIGIAAGLVSLGIRTAYEGDEAKILIWSMNLNDLSVRYHTASPVHFHSYTTNGWTIFADQTLLAQIEQCRSAMLPRETGGVLIGSFDTQRRIVYIAEQVVSPKDSEERPTSYIRGCEGLEERTQEISKITQGGLEYIGEWHSHPDGYDAERSPTDWAAIYKLSELMFPEGLPVVMLIVAENADMRIYLETPESLPPSAEPATKTSL